MAAKIKIGGKKDRSLDYAKIGHYDHYRSDKKSTTKMLTYL